MRQSEAVDSAIAGLRSPGTLLAEQREEYGWSVREVASAMRLSERQIEAIEADDYDNLPGKTYVMGYWRSYAQLLQIDIDESIQIHRSNVSAQVREIALDRSPSQVKGSEEQSRKRAAALFACLLAVFLGAVWYWQDPQASIGEWVSGGIDSLTGNGVETVESPDAVAPLVLPESDPPAGPARSVLALPEPNFSEGQEAVAINTRGYEVMIAELPLSRRDLIYQPWPEPDEPGTTGETATAKAADSAPATEDENAAVLAAAAAEAAANRARQAEQREAEARAAAERARQAAAANEATAAQAASAATGQAASTSTDQAATASTGQARGQGSDQTNGQISFQVANESWIDVRDSTGERLIYRTVNRGEDIRLSGIPPYSVFIGSAEGVAVQYQGQPVPFKIHQSGLFARFQVGR